MAYRSSSGGDWTSDAHVFDTLLNDLNEVDARLVAEIDERRSSTEPSRHRDADRALLEWLTAGGLETHRFRTYYPRLAQGLMEYGWSVLVGWITTGRIFELCRELGRPVTRAGLAADQRIELASETILAGHRLFLRLAVQEGRWRPESGRSLRAYFVGSCIREFPAVYRRWCATEHRAAEVLGDRDVSDDLVQLASCDLDPAEEVETRDFVARVLDSAPDATLRALARYLAQGYTQTEAARRLGLTPKAAERRLARWRARIRRDGPPYGRQRDDAGEEAS
jgi:DNA-directed RNA polymerase specialized sigma24 family protein